MTQVLQKRRFDRRRGQALLLAVLMLGATMLGATTIAGLLMAYQIRQVTNFSDSAKSVFAADAGTEWALDTHFHTSSSPSDIGFSNGATDTVMCYNASGTSMSCSSPSSSYAISIGLSGGTERAFLANFMGATSSLP
jgi:hypothetical protein